MALCQSDSLVTSVSFPINVCNVTAQKYLLYTNDRLYHTVQALNQISQ